MKRKMLILATAAVAGMLLLTACTSSEDTGKQPQGGQGTATNQSGEINATGTVTNLSGDQGSASAPSAAGTSNAPAATGNGAAGTSGDSDWGTVPQGDPVEDGGPVGDVIPDEDAQAAENDTEDTSTQENADDIWSGVYIGDEETVTIALVSKDSISFSFAQAGISGTASVNGHQAVYNGDDHHVVVFNVNQDMIDISVSSEEDFDASGSPLIGTYIRES